MPMLDVFNSDIFNVVSLTTSINKLPYVPGRLGALGLFKEQGVTHPTVVIEEKHGILQLVKTAARATMPNVLGMGRRKARSFIVPHIPLNAAVYADDVQGVRAFGSETDLETVSGLVNDKLEACKQSLEVTKEYHRIGALKGTVLDADGSTVIYDLFDEFDLTQEEVEFDFSDTAVSIKQQALNVMRLIGNFLGATMFTGVHAMCGDGFYDDLTQNEEIKDAITNSGSDNEFRRNQQARTVAGFEFGGITWENYRGKVGTVDFIESDECHFFPVGVPGLFATYYAPAEFIETVNTVGKSFYSKQLIMPYDVGVEIHTQTNPLMMCTRPSVLIKGTNTTPSG